MSKVTHTVDVLIKSILSIIVELFIEHLDSIDMSINS